MRWILFLPSLFLPQKKFELVESKLVHMVIGRRKGDMVYMGMVVVTNLMRVALPI